MDIDERTRERLGDIVAAIRDSISSIDDLQFDLLREASSRKIDRPPLDKTLSQARRSLEKAAHLLDL
jgi:hypothetical protein